MNNYNPYAGAAFHGNQDFHHNQREDAYIKLKPGRNDPRPDLGVGKGRTGYEQKNLQMDR